MRAEERGDATGVPQGGTGVMAEDPSDPGEVSWEEGAPDDVYCRDDACCRDVRARSVPCRVRCGGRRRDASCCHAEEAVPVPTDDGCLRALRPDRVGWGDCDLLDFRDGSLGCRGACCRRGASPGCRDACCRPAAYCCSRGCSLRERVCVRCCYRCYGGFRRDGNVRVARCGGCLVLNDIVHPSPAGQLKALRIMWLLRYCVITVSCLDGLVLDITA